MDKSTVTTFTFNRCCINFFSDGDLSFYDYTSDDTIVISGVENQQVKDAITRYVHNIARQDDATEHVAWLEELISKSKESIKLINNTNEVKS